MADLIKYQDWIQNNKPKLKKLVDYLEIKLNNIKDALLDTVDDKQSLILRGRARELKELIQELE